jgi:PilZ domain-containing protein
MRIDNRGQVRRPIHIRAKLVSSDGSLLRDWMVLDISATGARIKVDRPQQVPDVFTIVFTPLGRPYRVCHTTWRTTTQIGVMFDRKASSHIENDKALAS